jgi:hypothetical protein
MVRFVAGTAVGTALMVASAARADSVALSFVNGTTNFTTAINNFQTTGSMMDGMRLTAFFGDGSSELEFTCVIMNSTSSPTASPTPSSDPFPSVS